MSKILLYLERTSELFAEVFATIGRNKLRTSLTGLSVTVGLFLLIFLIGSGNGIIHAMEKGFGNIPLDLVSVYGGTTSKPHNGLQSGRYVQLDNRDLALSSPDIDSSTAQITAGISKSSVMMSRGSRRVTAELQGVYPMYADMQSYKLLKGRFVTETDLRERRKTIVIGVEDAVELFGNADAAIGKSLRVDNTMWQVVGVLADNKGEGVSTAGRGFVPFSTLRIVYNMGTKIDFLQVRTKGLATDEDNSAYSTAMRHTLAGVHSFAPDDNNAVWISSSYSGAKESKSALSTLRTSIWVIGLLTLLSAVVGISNIMLISVKERTREFGIRKALGAKPSSILIEVIIESIIITLFFGYVGLVIGVIGTEILDMVAHSREFVMDGFSTTIFENPTVDMGVAINALLVIVMAGVVAGYFPAKRAVSIKPVEALKG